ncbi:MAG: hypothetical protein ACI9WS_002026, partial [Paraglaciecola psychrophila]
QGITIPRLASVFEALPKAKSTVEIKPTIAPTARLFSVFILTSCSNG